MKHYMQLVQILHSGSTIRASQQGTDSAQVHQCSTDSVYILSAVTVYAGLPVGEPGPHYIKGTTATVQSMVEQLSRFVGHRWTEHNDRSLINFVSVDKLVDVKEYHNHRHAHVEQEGNSEASTVCH